MPGIEQYFQPNKRSVDRDVVEVFSDSEAKRFCSQSSSSSSGTSVSQTDPAKSSLLWEYLHEPSWRSAVSQEFNKPYFKEIESVIAKEWKDGKTILPPREQIFSALNFCPIDKISVVVIGQDPYHNLHQAHGLCFSVSPGVDTPPSLKNMYQELKTDIPGFEVPKHGCLIPWARQGVLLLNASLTVQAHQANSHAKIGWQIFTDACISHLNKNCKSLVFLLLGNFAQKKCKSIDEQKHHVIRAAHPSPLSVTRFKGCRIFSQCNEYLKKSERPEIDWRLPVMPLDEWKTTIESTRNRNV